MTEMEMRPILADWLKGQGMEVTVEKLMAGGYCDIVGFRFGERVSRKIPTLEAVWCIESKIRNARGAFWQAWDNQFACNRSYVAFPVERHASLLRGRYCGLFASVGIGVLYVEGDRVIEAVEPADTMNPEKRRDRIKKLWTSRRI
jgi:hypothetical protein